MKWLEWLFCPHNWVESERFKMVKPDTKGVIGFVIMLKCSKCTRIMTERVEI